MQQLQDALVFDRDLSHDDWSKLRDLTREKVEQTKLELTETHNNKLQRLGVLPPIDDKHVNCGARGSKVARQPTAFMSDPIFNLSSRELNDVGRAHFARA